MDRVVRLHTDKLMSSVLTNEGQAFREDMTLLVRRFNISVNTTPTQPNILGPDTLQGILTEFYLSKWGLIIYDNFV